RQRYRSHKDDEDHAQRSSSDRKRDDRSRRSHSRSPIRSAARHDSRSSYSRDSTSHHRARDRRESRDDQPSQPEKHREYVVKKPDDGGKYGLVHVDGATQAKNIDRTTLGPSTAFLEQAREKKRREEEEIQRKLGKSTRNDTRLSHDEMMKRAAQMAEDAKARDSYLEKRAAEKKERLDEEEQKLRKDPHFLKQLQDAVYIQSDTNVEDRLRRNAHYIQKRADASNFLSKHD
ncbi:hypothetical protein PINS_up023535, partial [Pythium insidiosum]